MIDGIDNLDVYILLLLAVIAGWLMGRFAGRGKSVARESQDIFTTTLLV